ncbi:MAG: KamA family radical SAM protein [Candidatus Dadabacteria bacterium]|nr:KamA family radical SAM protein [Candidatus Dadabacteria bacterium]
MSEFSDSEEPPYRRFWADVSENEWRDWKWQLKNRIRTFQQLEKLLPFTEDEEERIKRVISTYHVSIPPYYFSLINPDDHDDPIRKQAVPTPEEIEIKLGEDDPLDEEDDSPVEGLTHRYPDRVLMYIASFCPVYCRHCTRKREWLEGEYQRTPEELDRMLAYIRGHEEIRDVIISGGDPLASPIHKLEYILQNLRAIPHIDVIRIGSRVPVFLPMRINDELTSILEKYGPIWINTHFNHPNEITPYSEEAVLRLLKAGCPVNNQAVLLKGVNDDLETMKSLLRGLLKIRVRPYYLFHCDPVNGAAHFRTSVWKGIEIIEGLRGHISGLAIPTYVVDAPGGGGKIPLMPNYMLSASDDAVILRNYEGVIVKYDPDGRLRKGKNGNHNKNGNRKNNVSREATPIGISGLFESDETSIIPRDLPRVRRRRTAI